LQSALGVGAAAIGVGVGAVTAAAASSRPHLPPRSQWREPGSRPNPSLPEGTDTLPEIEHIVVVMQENHSFDNYLGMLGRGDGLTLDHHGRPTNTNPDPSGGYVRSFHETTTIPGRLRQPELGRQPSPIWARPQQRVHRPREQQRLVHGVLHR
jgi:phospholipase C